MASPNPIFEAVVEEMEKQFGGVLPTPKQLNKELGIGLKECKDILREYKEAMENRSLQPNQPAKTDGKSKTKVAASAAAPVPKALRPVVRSAGNLLAPATKVVPPAKKSPAPATKAAPVPHPDVEETQKDDDTQQFEDGQGYASEPAAHLDGDALEDEEEEEEEHESDMVVDEKPAEPMSSMVVPVQKAAGPEGLPAKVVVKAVPVLPKASGPLPATPPCKRSLSFGEAGATGPKQLKIVSQAWLWGIYCFFSICSFQILSLPQLEAAEAGQDTLQRSMSERRVLADTCSAIFICLP